MTPGRKSTRPAIWKRRGPISWPWKSILASGFPADSDPRLSKLSDQIGDTIHMYEVAAAQAPRGSESETPSEPAPIDEIADLTLPAGDPRLALKAEKELISVPHDLPLTVNDSVLQYLSFFTTPRGRAIVEHGLAARRAVRRHDSASAEGRRRPAGFDLSGAGGERVPAAGGFARPERAASGSSCPTAASEYDLERSYWVDERSDPEKATRAAAHHMRDCIRMFGDWYLVMAAYNSGPLNVSRAIERTGYADYLGIAEAPKRCRRKLRTTCRSSSRWRWWPRIRRSTACRWSRRNRRRWKR